MEPAGLGAGSHREAQGDPTALRAANHGECRGAGKRGIFFKDFFTEIGRQRDGEFLDANELHFLCFHTDEQVGKVSMVTAREQRCAFYIRSLSIAESVSYVRRFPAIIIKE